MNKELIIKTFETIIDIIDFNGDSGIVNYKRKETFLHAIDNLKNDELDKLTKKPKEIIKKLKKSDEITLESKSPYNGITIKNGIIMDEEVNKKMKAFDNLKVLIGVGIGIGNVAVRELVELGFTDMDDLKKNYEQKELRKGLKGSLKLYFEGVFREKKMTREEATDWKNELDKISEDLIGEEGFYKMAGSYARKKTEIGDIDYLITLNDPQKLYTKMKIFMDKLSNLKKVGEDEVKLNSVEVIPSKPKLQRYTTSIRMWFERKNHKVKIEIYGYAQPKDESCFPFFARAASTELQKKLKIIAIKKGYKLSPWSLDKSGTDEAIPKEVIKEKIGKDKITCLKDLYTFLDYSD